MSTFRSTSGAEYSCTWLSAVAPPSPPQPSPGRARGPKSESLTTPPAHTCARARALHKRPYSAYSLALTTA